MSATNLSAVRKSGELLLLAKNKEEVEPVVMEISAWSADALEAALDTRERRLAFWINLYNAYLQILLQRDPLAIRKKVHLFMKRHFSVAGHPLSLEEIEHDLLRRGTFKLSLGYLRDPFLSDYKKRLMVPEIEPRIHFALNCGARSCPPIRFYEAGRIDEQLDLATRSYLSQDAVYDPRTQKVTVTPLFSWFRGDFGGVSGIKEFLRKYEIIPDTNVKLNYSKYDWEAEYDHFA